ncbi:hypothetical protein HPB52_004316 [Rhipicephalus sanguineus]|uniref:Uncharacterized protein n=1 Tax=Rhipicephalus sanguineus TaxID=34632 RepID=A0A9D4PN00_RHISA|nr:hypothetical protein HPB52_004316 [Rhipicephalus sanguineus]
MIDTDSSECLLRESAAVQCGAQILEDATALYGFGSQDVPAVRGIAKCRADLKIDGVVGRDIAILFVLDEAQSVDLIVGRPFTELSYVTKAKVGGSLHFWHRDQCPFAQLEPLVSCPKLLLNTAEETTPQADVVNLVSPQFNVIDRVLFDNCGREIVIDTEGGEHNDCEEERGAVESEQILLTETQQANMREEFGVAAVHRLQGCNVVSSRACTGIVSPLTSATLNPQPSLRQTCRRYLQPGNTPDAVQPFRTNVAKPEDKRDIIGEWKFLNRDRDVRPVTVPRPAYASPLSSCLRFVENFSAR